MKTIAGLLVLIATSSGGIIGGNSGSSGIGGYSSSHGGYGGPGIYDSYGNPTVGGPFQTLKVIHGQGNGASGHSGSVRTIRVIQEHGGGQGDAGGHVETIRLIEQQVGGNGGHGDDISTIKVIHEQGAGNNGAFSASDGTTGGYLDSGYSNVAYSNGRGYSDTFSGGVGGDDDGFETLKSLKVIGALNH